MSGFPTDPSGHKHSYPVFVGMQTAFSPQMSAKHPSVFMSSEVTAMNKRHKI